MTNERPIVYSTSSRVTWKRHAPIPKALTAPLIQRLDQTRSK